MKKTLLYIVLALGITVAITSCEENWNAPDLEVPESTLVDTRDIALIKRIHDRNTEIGPDSIIFTRGKYVIEVWVTSSDEEKNFSKSIFIQDSTGGIELLLDKEYLHLDLPVGQKLLIQCNNLVVGDVNNLHQLGWREGNDVTPIHSLYMWNYIQKSGLPDISKMPSPTLIRTAADLTMANVGKLVEIENCRCEENISDDQDHILYFNGSDSVLLQIANTAKFSNAPCFDGEQNVKGILTISGSTYYLRPRTAADIQIYPVFVEY